MQAARISFALLVACAVLFWGAWRLGSAAAVPLQEGTVNPDARVLAEFTERVERYVELRRKVAEEAPPPKPRTEPEEIKAAQKQLADEIRTARKDARPGEIFTPEVQALFRRLMAPEVKGPGAAATRETIKEDAPKAVPLKVNASYPEGTPLPTVPPNVLAVLPELPEDLEYRIVNRDLILRDVQANLIVDFVPNVMR